MNDWGYVGPAAPPSVPVPHPWAGTPRWFSALAMPNGDARFGVEGELVQLQAWPGGGGTPKVQLFSRGEAEQLVAELRGALRCFDHARALAEGLAPRACAGPYPFAHRTLAEIDGVDMTPVFGGIDWGRDEGSWTPDQVRGDDEGVGTACDQQAASANARPEGFARRSQAGGGPRPAIEGVQQ